MSEAETQELIQTYRDRYLRGQYDEINAWEFLANSLARDLIESKSQIRYMKTKIREMEELYDTSKSKK